MNPFDGAEGRRRPGGQPRSRPAADPERSAPMHDHDRGLSSTCPPSCTRWRALQLAAAGGLAAVRRLRLVGRLGRGGVEAAATGPRRRRRPGRRRRPPPRCPRRRPGHSRPTAPTAPTCSRRAAIVSERHHLELRIGVGDGRGRAGGDRPHDHRRRRRQCAARGRAVYIWHCDREGRYSIYDAAAGGRELPARRPGVRRRPGGWRSPASGPAPTPGAGPTSTSRSTRASTMRRPPGRSW